MTADTLKRSPLAGVALPEGLRELPLLAQIDLRADPADAGTMQRLATALGHELPVAANTVTGGPERYALWLGPDEWLLVGPTGAEADLEGRCRAALGEAFGSVVDVSANRTTLELKGPSARAALEAGCSIDLHPRAFWPGRCAQTLVSRVAVILQQTTDEPCYRLLVRPSFADYLAAWLKDALEPA